MLLGYEAVLMDLGNREELEKSAQPLVAYLERLYKKDGMLGVIGYVGQLASMCGGDIKKYPNTFISEAIMVHRDEFTEKSFAADGKRYAIPRSCAMQKFMNDLMNLGLDCDTVRLFMDNRNNAREIVNQVLHESLPEELTKNALLKAIDEILCSDINVGALMSVMCYNLCMLEWVALSQGFDIRVGIRYEEDDECVNDIIDIVSQVRDERDVNEFFMISKLVIE